MSSVLQKLRTVTLSTIHGLLDAAIDMNSIGAVKQNIRDLEEATKNFEGATQVQTASVRGLTREVRDLTSEAADLNATIDAILTDDDPLNDYVATEKQVELTGLEANLAAKQEELDAGKAELQAMEQGLSLMRSRQKEMMAQLSKLESMDRNAKAKEKSTAALANARKAFDTSVDASVDGLGRKIQARKDVADVAFEQELKGLQQVGQNTGAVALANKAIAERKARLAAAAQGTAPAQAAAA